MKTCIKCNISQDFESFHRDKSRSDGIYPVCKSCKKEKAKVYYKQKSKRVLEQQKAYYQENKVFRAEYSKNYYSRNTEACKERVRRYKETNKKLLTKNRRAYEARRVRKDSLFKLKKKISSLFRNSFKNKGFSKSSKTAQLLGCSFEELQKHLKATFEMNYGLPFSWIDESLLHIDHIIPLAMAKTEEDLIKLNHYMNLQYLLAEDNLEKGDSLDWIL